MIESRRRLEIVAIVGETATGKTDIGEAVAEAIGGEVVCADSRQVFAELDIGTGKPDTAMMAERPHHLFDALHVGDPASSGWYLEAVRATCAAIQKRGRIPVLVGGSGLYVEAAREGLAETPPSDPAVRDALRAQVAAGGPEALHRRLLELDPETAGRLAPRDAQRVLRALEVLEVSGRPLSWWHAQPRAAPAGGACLAFQVTCPLVALTARIRRRTAWMYDHGLIEETRSILASDRAAALIALRAIGYDEATDWIGGRIDRAAAMERTSLRTIQFAKRQRTWFRNRGRALPVPATEAVTEIVQAIRSA
jgi:tRNA dimethylallyltransferase